MYNIVPESSIMLIMTLAHARASGDGHLLSLHVRVDVFLCQADTDAPSPSQYNLLKAWGNYLVNNTLTPTQQLVSPEARYSISNYPPGSLRISRTKQTLPTWQSKAL